MYGPIARPEFSRLSAKDWAKRYPLAVIDEIQKLPSLMQTVKAGYDQQPEIRYVLVGSSQIMPMKGIQRTLAGRAVIQQLPLKAGVLPLMSGLSMPGCIRDAAPDAWGRRVLINKNLGLKGADADSAQLDELTYLLESCSDRIGALDFQISATDYVPRTSVNVTLDELLQSAERVEKGIR
jgi:hypothetical protein